MPVPLPDLSDPATPLSISPWHDAVLDTIGHDPRSPYVERFWLVILGPSALLLLRLVADELDRSPDGFVTTLPDLGRALGLAYRPTTENVLVRAIERLSLMTLARVDEGNVLAIRRNLASISARQLHRLPAPLRAEHAGWIDANPRMADHAQQRTRARHLALSLLEVGDDPGAVERQLHRWGFHPALAHDGVRWAAAEHLNRTGEVPVAPRLVALQAVAAAPAAGA